MSNGEQTRTLYETLQGSGTFEAALAQHEHEPDAPHYTPRVSAMLALQQLPGTLTLSILKANVADPACTDRFTYRSAVPPPGFGIGLTTYRGDGTLLPSFQDESVLLPCRGAGETVLGSYWAALNPDNRVAIAMKWIPPDGGPSTVSIRNRFGGCAG